jgi:hypothetical protein
VDCVATLATPSVPLVRVVANPKYKQRRMCLDPPKEAAKAKSMAAVTLVKDLGARKERDRVCQKPKSRKQSPKKKSRVYSTGNKKKLISQPRHGML